MFIISNEICLVIMILAILSSASPVDRAMKYKYKYWPSASFRHFTSFSSNSTVGTGNEKDFPHYARTETKRLMGHIDTYVIRNNSGYYDSTHSVYSRPQRSHRPRSKSRVESDYEHYSVKAFKAKIVLHVKAQSVQTALSKNRCSYSVHFKIIKTLKRSSWPIHEMINLRFLNSTGKCNKKRRKLVRADIRASEEYVVFLNATSSNDYKNIGAPEPLKKKKGKDDMLAVLEKICNPKFSPKPVQISKLEDKSSWNTKKRRRKQRLKLICRSSGLPFPRIVWKKDNVTLTNSTRVQITYVRRRSTLKIRNATEQDSGRYECVSWGLNHSYQSKSIEVQVKKHNKSTTSSPLSEIDSKRPCDNEYATVLCLNGGKCYQDIDPFMPYCECPYGLHGERCEYHQIINRSN